MSFNLFAVIGSFFSHLTAKSPTPAAPAGSYQSAVDRIGQILDSCEGYVTELQTLIPLLPPQAAGPASIFANGVHTLDAYMDMFETPVSNAPPTSSVSTPTGPAPATK